MTKLAESRLSARLQEFVSRRREQAGLYREIAEQLPLVDAERVLDVGTGTGLQLRVIYEMQPDVGLYGLDLSAATIKIAERNLQDLDADLRVGSIEATSFEDGFFDIVTCNASMSYWQNPIACFDEIYRILKPGGCAVFFEPQTEIDIDAVVATLRANLADANPLRRWLAVRMNKWALTRGGRVGLRLYAMDELSNLAAGSRFGNSHTIELSDVAESADLR